MSGEWLRRMQVVGVIGQIVAVAMMFCHLAFGTWKGVGWYYPLVILLQLVFVISLVFVIRWRRVSDLP